MMLQEIFVCSSVFYILTFFSCPIAFLDHCIPHVSPDIIIDEAKEKIDREIVKEYLDKLQKEQNREERIREHDQWVREFLGTWDKEAREYRDPVGTLDSPNGDRDRSRDER